MVLTFDTPTNNVWNLRFHYILANIWCCQSLALALSVAVSWYYIVVFIYIFLVTKTVELLFFVKCLLKFFCYFKNIWLSVLKPLSKVICLYNCGSIQNFIFCLIYLSIFMLIQHSLDYCKLIHPKFK